MWQPPRSKQQKAEKSEAKSILLFPIQVNTCILQLTFSSSPTPTFSQKKNLKMQLPLLTAIAIFLSIATAISIPSVAISSYYDFPKPGEDPLSKTRIVQQPYTPDKWI